MIMSESYNDVYDCQSCIYISGTYAITAAVLLADSSVRILVAIVVVGIIHW